MRETGITIQYFLIQTCKFPRHPSKIATAKSYIYLVSSTVSTHIQQLNTTSSATFVLRIGNIHWNHQHFGPRLTKAMPSLNGSLATAATRIALLSFFWENWGSLLLAIRQKQSFSNPYIWKWAIHAWEKHPPRLQTTWNLTLTPISTSSLSGSTFEFFRGNV